jgi:hypothetical protein
MSAHAGWDAARADALLSAHAFSALDALIRRYVDGLRHHEAVDWVEARALEGHLVVLYHCVRNLAKCSPSRVGGVGGGGGIGGEGERAAAAAVAAAGGGSAAGYAAGWLWRLVGGGGRGGGGGGGGGGEVGLLAAGSGGSGGAFSWAGAAASASSSSSSSAWSGCRVMGSSELRRAFALGVWLLLRCAQDVLAVAAVQGEPPGRGAVVFAMMRDKLLGWLLAQFPLSRFPPLRDVLRDVRRLHEASSGAARASATWCFRTGPSASARYLPWGTHIAFGDPGPQLASACARIAGAIAEERARVAELALALLGSLTWEGLAAAPLSLFLSSSLCGASRFVPDGSPEEAQGASGTEPRAAKRLRPEGARPPSPAAARPTLGPAAERQGASEAHIVT